MVQQLACSGEVRTRERPGTEAGEAHCLGGLRMERGMVTASTGGMAANMVKQSRRKYSDKLRDANGWLDLARKDAKRGDYKASREAVQCARAALDLALQYNTGPHS